MNIQEHLVEKALRVSMQDTQVSVSGERSKE